MPKYQSMLNPYFLYHVGKNPQQCTYIPRIICNYIKLHHGREIFTQKNISLNMTIIQKSPKKWQNFSMIRNYNTATAIST